MIGTALGHRGRRRPARPGARRARRRRSAPSRSSARCSSIAVLLAVRRLAAAGGRRARAPDAARGRRRRWSAGRSSTATAFVAVPSVMFGAIEVLVPLRIDALGGGHALIAGGLHRRRRAGGGAGADRRPLLRPGRPARCPTSVGLAICAVAMVAIALAQTLGVVLAGSDPHLARRRPLLRPGADAALRDRRVERPAPGLRRRPLEHGLGVGPGDRRHRRRRRRQRHRQRGAEHRDRRCCWR